MNRLNLQITSQSCLEWGRLIERAALVIVVASAALLFPGLRCTEPACCVSNADCDDGDFCNGAETCNSAEGECCQPGDPPCGGGQCFEDRDECCGCAEDADCSDDVFCNGAELCVDCECILGEPPCGDVCDEQADCCAECLSDDDCDDGLFCNGAEFCGEQCQCEFGTPACEDCCFEEFDECASACNDNSDCDDLNPCTVEMCVGCGICESAPVDCDDGVDCTTDSCDDGVCRSVDNCSAGSACNLDTGQCEVDPCAGCDDGLFCNGIETCVNGVCIAGERPCDDGGGVDDTCEISGTQACFEGDSGPVCTPFIVDPYELTLGCDNLVGTSCPDSFHASREFVPAIGMAVATLQDCDRLDGRGDVDTLDVTAGPAGMVRPTFISIERINIAHFDTDPGDASGFTLSLLNSTGVDVVTSVDSIDDVVVSDLQELADFGLSGINNSSVDFALKFSLPSTTSGASDSITGTFTNAIAGTVTIETAAGTANGFETLNLASTGSTNSVERITQANGTTLATINVVGYAALTVRAALDDSVTRVDGSLATGDLSVILGASSVACIGSAGADRIVGGPLAELLEGRDGADVINGGAGFDTIVTGNEPDVVILDRNSAADGADVTDFTAGISGDVARFDLSEFGLAGDGEYVGAISGLSVDSSTEIAILTGGGYASDDAAEDAVADRIGTDGLDVIVIYFNTTANRTHVIYDTDAGANDADGSVVLVGRFLNLTAQAMHDALTAANVDTQP